MAGVAGAWTQVMVSPYYSYICEMIGWEYLCKLLAPAAGRNDDSSRRPSRLAGRRPGLEDDLQRLLVLLCVGNRSCRTVHPFVNGAKDIGRGTSAGKVESNWSRQWGDGHSGLIHQFRKISCQIILSTRRKRSQRKVNWRVVEGEGVPAPSQVKREPRKVDVSKPANETRYIHSYLPSC